MASHTSNILYKKELESALNFISRSIEVNDGQGSSHSYSYWLNPNSGWHCAYPETTGYLIPTLISASFLLNDEVYMKQAETCADWLVAIQDEAGWFYTGVHKSGGPSTFNTAMILFGLTAAVRQFPEEKYKDALTRSVTWLLSLQEKDGHLLKFAFHPNFQPSYYTRILWALTEANEVLLDTKIVDACHRLKDTLKPLFHLNGVDKAVFDPSEPAFLHTMAYAYRGASEYNQTVKKDDFLLSGLDLIVSAYKSQSRWPGSVNHDGTWNTNFRCLTGEAQMAIMLLQSDNPSFVETGRKTLDAVVKEQKKHGQARGGLQGSKPFWGPYMPLRYPNWATKFLIDAILAVNGLKVRG